jgi:uncharacterized protein (TIGR03437 family)
VSPSYCLQIAEIEVRMRYILALLIFLAAGLAAQEPAQTSYGFVGYGYTPVTPVITAPGQLLTLLTTGGDGGCVSSAFSARYCSIPAPAGADLPTTLGGITVNYSVNPPSGPNLPILDITMFSARAMPGSPAAPLAAITVQIPFEASGCRNCTAVINVNPGPGESGIDVITYPDQVHVLTSCDSFMQAVPYGTPSFTGLPCSSIITHADGSPVSATSPATPGEEVVAYAVGLGQTTPPLVTGQLVTAAAPTVTTFGLDFNFHPNALPSKPLPSAPPPVYAGATPGFVGLYQVNFVVPPVPAGTTACYVQPSGTTPADFPNVVQSNLTVSVGGVSSFDGARICVAVP